jgi:hypothetical protein
MIKARKLARVTTPSEWETDADEWPRLIEENAGLRILQGGKKLSGHDINHYDILLLTFITAQNQKATKVINQALSKHKLPTGDTFLHWRLRVMAELDEIEMSKGDVKLKGKSNASEEESNEETT